jgi:2-oxoglutarate ferredoxin oxidoreductase subunit alpha
VRDSKGAYFTRGSGHDEGARYTESSDIYPRVMDRLTRKYETARTLVPAPVVEPVEGAEIGFLAYGSSHWAMVEARERLAAQSLETSYLLLKALPFTAEVPRFLERHSRIYVVEQNRDGQMAALLKAEYPKLAGRIRSVLHYTGLPITAGFVTAEVLKQEAAMAPVAEGMVR